MKRLLVIARDFNAAKHWANQNKLSPGRWVYVSSFHNIQGNPECDYFRVEGYKLRPDMDLLESALKRNKCTEITHLPVQS